MSIVGFDDIEMSDIVLPTDDSAVTEIRACEGSLMRLSISRAIRMLRVNSIA